MLGDVLVAKPDLWTADVATLRSWVRVPHTNDDDVLVQLAQTAEKRIQQRTQWIVTQESRMLTLGAFPPVSTITIPRRPLVAVSAITYTTVDGEQTLAGNQYTVDTSTYPGRVALTAGNWWPEDVLYVPPVQIAYTAGWDDLDDVMPDLLEAVRLLVAFWYENREAGVASTFRRAETASLPYGVDDLLESLMDV